MAIAVDDETRGHRLRQLPDDADDVVEKEPERGAGLQRVRPLPQTSQRKLKDLAASFYLILTSLDIFDACKSGRDRNDSRLAT